MNPSHQPDFAQITRYASHLHKAFQDGIYIDALTGSQKGYIVDHQPCFQMIKHNALHDAMNDAEQMAIAKNYFAAVVNTA